MSEKLRVYELAKEMLTDSKVIIRVMAQMGLDAKNHMSTLDQPTAQKIRDVLTGKTRLKSEAKEQPKAEPPKARAPQARPDTSAKPEPTRPAERSTPREAARKPHDKAGMRQPWLDATRPVVRSEKSSHAKVERRPEQARSGKPPTLKPGWPASAPSEVFGPKPYTPGPTASIATRPSRTTRTRRVAELVSPEKTRQTETDSMRTERAGADEDKQIHDVLPQASAETSKPEVAPETQEREEAKVEASIKTREVAERADEDSRDTQQAARTEDMRAQTERPAAPRPSQDRQDAPARAQMRPREQRGTGYRTPGYPERSRSTTQAARERRPSPQDSRTGARAQQPQSRPMQRPDTRRPYSQQPRPGQGGTQAPAPRRPIDASARPAPRMPIVPVPTPVQGGEQRAGGPRKPKQGPSQPVYGKRERRERSEEGQRLSKLRKMPGRRTDARSRGTEPPKEVVIDGSITLKDLASKMALSAAEVIKRLLTQGIMLTINQELDPDTAQLVGMHIGIPVKYKAPELTAEQKVEQQALEQDAPETLEPRPPVVTVMGHVDHGKTSLLDAIRKTDVAAGEAGGITQHIGASVVEIDSRKVVFLDTPGHEAFTAMRARGAEATDIAVLVVAADDGVMPQTVEAINHAKAAGVPVVVAMNKVDKPNADPDRVKNQLLEHELVPEEWGGQTIVVPVSAKEGTGIDDLLEMILLTAEIEELRANPNRLARGFVIEAQLDKGRGPVATVLVQNGTLHVGNAFVIGSTYGRVRAMMDDKGRRVDKAGPATPVEVVGLTDLPQAGDIFQAVDDEKIAREIASQRSMRKRAQDMESSRKVSLEDLFQQTGEGEVRDLNILVKADVQGTLEAIRKALEGLKNEEVRVSIIHEGVGGINESDIMLASASDAVILGFNVRPDAGARRVAEAERVEIKPYRVIYDAIEDIKAALKGMLKPKVREVTYGRASVRQVFRVPKVGTVAGCYVTDGKVMRNASVRVVRDSIVLHEGRLASLKRFKDDVREVQEGFECGIGLERFQDLQEGDVLEFFGQEEVKQA